MTFKKSPIDSKTKKILLINKYVRELENAIDRLEKGLYPTHSSEWCANRINWLYQFRIIDRKTMSDFADRMIKIFELERY